MGKKSSKVMTPRNVDLPLHVMRNNINNAAVAVNANGGSIIVPNKDKKAAASGTAKKKCLCLTLWLFGLIFLCVAVVVIANFILPLSQSSYGIVCLERNGISLEQKASLSDLIVVGRLESRFDSYGGREQRSDGGDNVARVKVQKTLKSDDESASMPESLKFSMRDADSPCHISVEDARKEKIFFLSKYDQVENWTPRFRALEASAKLTNVIQSLIDKERKSGGGQSQGRNEFILGMIGRIRRSAILNTVLTA